MKRTEVGLAGGRKVEKEKSSRVSWRMNVLYQPPVHCEFIEDFPSDFLGYVRGLWPTLRASNRVVTRGEQGRHCQFNIWSSFSFCFSCLASPLPLVLFLTSHLSHSHSNFVMDEFETCFICLYITNYFVYQRIINYTCIFQVQSLLNFQLTVKFLPNTLNSPQLNAIQNSLPLKKKPSIFTLLHLQERKKNTKIKIPGTPNKISSYLQAMSR